MRLLKIEPSHATILEQSSCVVDVIDFDEDGVKKMIIRFEGACSKFPSTSNRRIITSGFGAAGGVLKLRPRMIRNNDEKNLLTAMTVLFRRAVADLIPQFPCDKHHRVFVLLLLGKSLDRTDSHNVPKAILDWLESECVFSNDRFVDCLALRKSYIGHSKPESSDIVIVRGECMKPRAIEFVANLEFNCVDHE